MTFHNLNVSYCILLVSLGVSQAAGNADGEGARPAGVATKAWGALKAGDHKSVYKLTTQCFKDFGDEAVAQQKELGEKITVDDPSSLEELNSVGTCLFILAESLSQQGYEEKSQSTLQKLIDDFPACQCKNKKGYYWKPAVAAEKQLAETLQTPSK